MYLRHLDKVRFDHPTMCNEFSAFQSIVCHILKCVIVKIHLVNVIIMLLLTPEAHHIGFMIWLEDIVGNSKNVCK